MPGFPYEPADPGECLVEQEARPDRGPRGPDLDTPVFSAIVHGWFPCSSAAADHHSAHVGL